MNKIILTLACGTIGALSILTPNRLGHILGAATSSYALVNWQSILVENEAKRRKKEVEQTANLMHQEMLAKHRLFISQLEIEAKEALFQSELSEASSLITSDNSDVITDDNNSVDWIEDASNYGTLLIFGGMGSGKTTLATEIISRRVAKGHQCLVIDPHAAKGQWHGLEVVGAGMDYTAINEELLRFERQTVDRYKLLADEGVEAVNRLPHLCIIIEEFTNYAARVPAASGFLQACMSDNRKVNMSAIFISHNNTLPTLGGAKGIAQLRDDACFEIKLIPPSGKQSRQCYVKYPGQKFTQVAIPELTPWIPQIDVPTGERDRLERLYLQEHPEPSDSKALVVSSEHYTSLELPIEEAVKLVFRMMERHTKEEVIKLLWGASKGGSSKYQHAYNQLQEILNYGRDDI